MNTPESANNSVSKQAIAPTPQLYDETSGIQHGEPRQGLTGLLPVNRRHQGGRRIDLSQIGLSQVLHQSDGHQRGALAIYQKPAADSHWPR